MHYQATVESIQRRSPQEVVPLAMAQAQEGWQSAMRLLQLHIQWSRPWPHMHTCAGM